MAQTRKGWAIKHFWHTVKNMMSSRNDKVKGLWFTQILEYVIGFALASAATRSDAPTIPALLAVLVIANAATVDAPLSAFHLTSPSVHKLLGVFLGVAALVAVVIADVDAMTRAVLVVTALAEGFVSVRFGHGIRKTST